MTVMNRHRQHQWQSTEKKTNKHQHGVKVRDGLATHVIIIIITDFPRFILDISQSRAEGPRQPHLKFFPLTLQAERRRGFMKDWYITHKWLEYSQIKDSTNCYACRHFSLPSSGDSVFTSEEGFKNWIKATHKDGEFVGHAKSESHNNAMLAWAEYEKSTTKNCSLSPSLNAERK